MQLFASSAVCSPTTIPIQHCGHRLPACGHTLDTGLSFAYSIGSRHSKFGLSPSSNLEKKSPCLKSETDLHLHFVSSYSKELMGVLVNQHVGRIHFFLVKS